MYRNIYGFFIHRQSQHWSFFMSAFVLRSSASQIRTKSKYSVRETSKRQSIPNPLSGECSIKTGSKLRESPFRVSRSIGGKRARRRAAIVLATAGKRDDKGKWTWEESGGFGIDEACLPFYPPIVASSLLALYSLIHPDDPSFFIDCQQIDKKIGRRVLPIVNSS